MLNEGSRNPVQGKERGGFLEEATSQSSLQLTPVTVCVCEFSSSCSPSLKVPAAPIVSPQSPSTLTGHLRDSIQFQGLRLCLCKQAPGTPDKNPPTHLREPLPPSWAAYRPDTCCRISLDTSVRAHTHTHSCTPRTGSSKQEKLGIDRASCRRLSQLLCSSLESSGAPAGTSPPPPHPQFQACGRQVLSVFHQSTSHPTALY